MQRTGPVLFSGNSNPGMAKEICNGTGIRLGRAVVKTFSDGETQVEIKDNVRGRDVFVLQSTCPPVNNHAMELLLMLDSLKRASVQRLTAVIPYYGYARQDRKSAPRVPISARVMADLIEAVGADRVITMDLHAGQIQGFFKIPVDNIYAKPVLMDYIQSEFNNNVVIVSPDAGGAERARSYAKRLNAGLALIDKRRKKSGKAEAMHVIGEVKDKIAVIVDDMVDTAGTLQQSSIALRKQGAIEIHACCAHAILSGPAIERINNSEIKTLLVTNTIPLNKKKEKCSKIVELSVSVLLAETIYRSHTGKSVSSLFV